MPPKRVAGVVLVAVGAVLLWQGWQARQSLGSRISQAMQGTPSDQALWLLIGGGVAVIAGIALAMRR